MEKTVNRILLVRVPAEKAVDGRELRDYILESLERGVLVLTEDASCEVMELPALGGVTVAAEPQAPPVPADSPEGPSEGDEKRAILRRLTEYRKVHGLGRWGLSPSKRPTIKASDYQRINCGRSWSTALRPAPWRSGGRSAGRWIGWSRKTNRIRGRMP